MYPLSRDYRAFVDKARANGKTDEEARTAAQEAGLTRFDYSDRWRRSDTYVRLVAPFVTVGLIVVAWRSCRSHRGQE